MKGVQESVNGEKEEEVCKSKATPSAVSDFGLVEPWWELIDIKVCERFAEKSGSGVGRGERPLPCTVPGPEHPLRPDTKHRCNTVRLHLCEAGGFGCGQSVQVGDGEEVPRPESSRITPTIGVVGEDGVAPL